jgi:rubrerythrin
MDKKTNDRNTESNTKDSKSKEVTLCPNCGFPLNRKGTCDRCGFCGG